MDETNKPRGLRAIIIGATGETGRNLMNYLSNSDEYSSVLSIGRRKSDMEQFQNDKVEQLVVNMEEIDKVSSRFSDRDVAFCCLGTTIKDAGSNEEFYKVDHDYVVNFATIAKEKGIEDFHLVSSIGSKASSWFFYLRTKGQTEEDCGKLNFNRYFIYKPGTLIERSNPRFLEKFSSIFMPSISVKKLGSVIGHFALHEFRKERKSVNEVTILANKDLLKYYDDNLKDQ